MILQKTCPASQNIAHYIYPILSLTITLISVEAEMAEE